MLIKYSNSSVNRSASCRRFCEVHELSLLASSCSRILAKRLSIPGGRGVKRSSGMKCRPLQNCRCHLTWRMAHEIRRTRCHKRSPRIIRNRGFKLWHLGPFGRQLNIPLIPTEQSYTISISRSRTCPLTPDCDTCSCRAASVKVWFSATAQSIADDATPWRKSYHYF